MAAHSQSSQSSPCNWVVEALGLRKSVFLVSSAIFLQRNPGYLPSDQLISEGMSWALRDSLLFTSGRSKTEAGEGLFPLFSGFIPAYVRIPHCQNFL